MTIYLYKKTHIITGLKYLGKTTAKDPHRYIGSGVYWKSHLKMHGEHYITEILKECYTERELRHWGKYYSDLWNIVDSPEWANLKEEVGDGGRQSEEVRKRIGEAGKGRIPWNKGKQVWSKEERKRISEQNKLRGPQSVETISKRVSKNIGKKRTDEQRKRASDAQKGRKLTPEHIEKLKIARRKGIQEGRIVPWNKK
jgi:NUMOD3 motif